MMILIAFLFCVIFTVISINVLFVRISFHNMYLCISTKVRQVAIFLDNNEDIANDK